MLAPLFHLWSRMTPLRLRLALAATGVRISRNQWDAAGLAHYREQMKWTWAETREKAPDYFKRLEASIAGVSGRVLEIGCGVGTMTRWIAASDKVTEVVAVDGFELALAELRAAKLPKVRPLHMQADNLRLPPGHFDTVMLCEVIEHLYADEELRLISSIRPHLAPNARYVVSCPVGWMEDATHVRAFGKRCFRRHLERYYGPVQKVDFSSGYSQVATGWWMG
ncbi:MAG: class I SAM-dependent methyltransferase [Planctomycetes bacterium]|nr:class I SAM-dependent methyltransferase [Planctomycetota bacterium]